MPNSGYFDVVFGVSGTRSTVPDSVQPDGTVSYTQGYGPDYTLMPGTPGSLNVQNYEMNQLFFDITSAIQQYQQFGTPPFITTAMNNGTPFSYDQYARVLYLGVVYQSLVSSNTDTPPSSNWAVADISASAASFIGGTTTGSANAQVLASLLPSGFSLTDGYAITFTAGFTNTNATTLAITSPAIIATPILKNSPAGPVALTGGEIVLNNAVSVIYNSTAAAFIINSAALGTAAQLNYSTDGTLAADSDALIATQKATKTYVDAAEAAAIAANPLKAWVNFAGASGTINAGLNVASVTRNSTGNYTVNFTAPLADAKYAMTGAATDAGAGIIMSFASGGTLTASACQVVAHDATFGETIDPTQVTLIFTR